MLIACMIVRVVVKYNWSSTQMEEWCWGSQVERVRETCTIN